MWKGTILVWLCLSGYCYASPLGPKRNMPIISREEEPTIEVNKPENENTVAVRPPPPSPNMPMISTLTLPSNATSIRADITDGFSCANKSYGYYADVENDCQIFHVCLPVTYADGKENTFRWSFICPEETIFSQDSFTCMRREDMNIDCEESFKYYELNRNFGMIDEENNRNPQQSENSESTATNVNEDQDTSMTTNIGHEEEIKPQGAAQMVMDDRNEKPNSPMFSGQKEKPMKVQKPNRRKPATPLSSNTHKKKPALSLRKTPQPAVVSPTVVVETLQPELAPVPVTVVEEVKSTPPRFTKRPATMSTNLKEKLQPVNKQPEVIPSNRVELFNQKRKRPSYMNKHETTTLLPVEDSAAITEQPVEVTKSEEIAVNTIQSKPIQDSLLAAESAPVAITLKPETFDTDSNNEKKVNGPQPTEPLAEPNNEINKLEEVVPLEAIEEIPAVIAEVEETKTNVDPSIFQQNSEENNAIAVAAPTIEEMEDKKPADAPDAIMTATPEMEQQDPIIQQMFPDRVAEADKQSMGGFKPVDPAMAAEAEALIADFLHTLMKTDQTNTQPILPTTIITNPTDEENTSIDEEAPKITDSEVQSPNMLPIMNPHHGDAFQIPVQIIQTPQLEEEVVPASESKPEPEPAEGTIIMSAQRPLSIDDVVELVKEQLDQKPEIQPIAEESNLTEADQTDQEKSAENTSLKLGESPIMPIYQRVSTDAVENVLQAHSAVGEVNPSSNTQSESETIPVDSTSSKATNETTNETTAETSKPISSVTSEMKPKIGRAQRARNIKTATKMDPRKRRFLFRSDAS